MTTRTESSALDELIELRPAAACVVAQHGHQRGAQHAPDQEVVEERRHLGGDAEGADLTAGAEQRGNDHLAQQAEYAAGQAARGQDCRRAGEAAGWRGHHERVAAAG